MHPYTFPALSGFPFLVAVPMGNEPILQEQWVGDGVGECEVYCGRLRYLKAGQSKSSEEQ